LHRDSLPCNPRPFAQGYLEFGDAELAGASRKLFFEKLLALDLRIVFIVDELDRVYKDLKTPKGHTS